nr:primosomal replication protein N [Pseudidiomarina aestuarii]
MTSRSSIVELSFNQLELSGVLTKPPQLTKSPAGIYHLRFVVEHRSEQVEANLPRRSYVRLQVVLSGQDAPQWSKELNVGQAVTVRGFLNREEDKNGIGKLVLHAQQLVLI